MKTRWRACCSRSRSPAAALRETTRLRRSRPRRRPPEHRHRPPERVELERVETRGSPPPSPPRAASRRAASPRSAPRCPAASWRCWWKSATASKRAPRSSASTPGPTAWRSRRPRPACRSRAQRARTRQQEAARLRLLLEQNAASQQRYDQLRTRAEVAGAQVAQMQARVAKARRDLAQTEVHAPYAASVVERRAHEGAMAGSGADPRAPGKRRARGDPERARGDAGRGTGRRPGAAVRRGAARSDRIDGGQRQPARRPGHAHLRGARPTSRDAERRS